MTRNILVVAAHSDDEALGCAGTLARHAAEGDRVHVVFLTDGVGARGPDAPQAQARQKAATKATSLIGAVFVTQFSFPDNKIDSIPLLDVIQAIASVGANVDPDIVYTHHSGDLNEDHRACHQAVLTAFRPMPGQSVRAIYGFEVASSTEWAFGSPDSFQPQHFVDISATLEVKMKALDAYASEMRPFPHVRSVIALKALARWRGATVGVEAAEKHELSFKTEKRRQTCAPQ